MLIIIKFTINGSTNFIVLTESKKEKGRLKPSFKFQTTFCHISNLVPSPVWRGKVRMGVALWL
ncbi:hypothetical protein [Neisseria sicca]|uniref:hypothetical protein n=1 Tax=Neisseria sicca TaxID=490 RepID=UPI0011BD0FC1|nr:hypothetical protein [Neisseria sicca]